MLLDEPFSDLDIITRGAMRQWFLGVTAKFGITALFVTHDIEEAIFLSDRIYIMTSNPGKITHEMTIAADKPRGIDFSASEEFNEYKRKIMDILKNDKFFNSLRL
jgi:ABC-type nitrate/sulfonate/bicarbonate transport system ATPase subunit